MWLFRLIVAVFSGKSQSERSRSNAAVIDPHEGELEDCRASGSVGRLLPWVQVQAKWRRLGGEAWLRLGIGLLVPVQSHLRQPAAYQSQVPDVDRHVLVVRCDQFRTVR